MSKLSSVKVESIEFAKRHFNASGGSNGFEDIEEDDDLEDRDPDGERGFKRGAYENIIHSSGDPDRAFSGLGSSNHHVKTELSFEEDLACFPASQYSDITPAHTDGDLKAHHGRSADDRIIDTESRLDVHLSHDEQMNTTFAQVQDQLDEEGIKNLFMQNQFELGFRQVKRLIHERQNALRESANMRHKQLKLEASERDLTSQN